MPATVTLQKIVSVLKAVTPLRIESQCGIYSRAVIDHGKRRLCCTQCRPAVESDRLWGAVTGSWGAAACRVGSRTRPESRYRGGRERVRRPGWGRGWGPHDSASGATRRAMLATRTSRWRVLFTGRRDRRREVDSVESSCVLCGGLEVSFVEFGGYESQRLRVAITRTGVELWRRPGAPS